jgi:tRNA A37 methylthiotransferase MiaB
MQKYFVIANGCPENRLDAARIEKYFAVNGWCVADNIKEADLILFNACGLKDESQTDSTNIIRHVYRTKSKNARVIVSGCLPKINPTMLASLHDGMTFGQDEEADVLNAYIQANVPIKDICANKPVQCTTSADVALKEWYVTQEHWVLLTELSALSQIALRRITEDPLLLVQFCVGRLCNREEHLYLDKTYYIKVSTGCVNHCSYCGVKFSRGHIRSKSTHRVLEEFQNGIENGYEDFILIGTEISSYGKDIGTDLITLLQQFLKIDRKFKIKLRNVHPIFLIENADKFAEIAGSGKISFIGAALQSGNNRILTLMNRGYTVEDFLSTIQRIKKAAPQIWLSTHIMVGFPTETQKDFNDSLRIAQNKLIDKAQAFIYSPITGTRAAEMTGHIPMSEKRRRFFRICQANKM